MVDPPKLIHEFAGKGEPVDDVPVGQPGSKERIHTDQVIGRYFNDDTKEFQPTKNFIIHYAKNGVHIVPARP